MAVQPVLIAGQWRSSKSTGTFSADNPSTCQPMPETYPISSWQDCDDALTAAAAAYKEMRMLPRETIAKFLEDYAARIDANSARLVEMAHAETALPTAPRLRDVELPRTSNQLRQAAEAVRACSWQHATIDTKLNLRSCFASIGPVCVFGPNNFPYAYNGVAGGDFAAAIAAGNPVIGKANPAHPGTTRLLAEIAMESVQATGMPAATVQLIYRTGHADGERLVSDPRTAATGYTGARVAGLKLKAAADTAGKPIYLELSSINPVVILPGALAERREKVVDDFVTSCLMAVGQFCTNPGLLVLIKGPETDRFLEDVRVRFAAAPVGTLLGKGLVKGLESGVKTLSEAGAKLLVGGEAGGGVGCSYQNTLLSVDAAKFIADPEKLQTEAFGNVALAVIADDAAQLKAVLTQVEGNLTGCFYSSTTGADDGLYDELSPILRHRVGRLLNDKMPTGVAVSPAMNHGGPYPATGHAGFTAVGIPAAIHRFAALQSYDNVRQHRLPEVLQDKNPTGRTWRFIDGSWTQADVGQ